MIALDIIIHGDNCWPDLHNGFITGRLVAIARLPNGTLSGKPTVAVRIELPDGQTVLAETTLALLSSAVRVFEVAP